MTYLFIWKIRSRNLPQALIRMALDRFYLRRDQRITFFKLLGTGSGERFTPSDADASTWGMLLQTATEFKDPRSLGPILRWRKFALSEEMYLMSPLSSHGTWAKKTPFARELMESSDQKWEGEVAAITRARIAWRHNFRFWRAVPPVTQSLHSSPGLLRAIGIGEAPIGLQGTFSHWNSSTDLRNFAYRGDAHRQAISQTHEINWYSEELFARFRVLSHTISKFR